ADPVAQHDVARGAGASQVNAIAVRGNEVGGAGGRAADGVDGRLGLDQHPVEGVGEAGSSGNVGTDQVAQHHVARGATAGDEHAVAAVAGDDVGGADCRAADGV